MNFYYDPIRGLQYTNLGELFLIDLNVIPNDFNVEKFIKEWQKWATFNWIPLKESQIRTVGRITTDFI
jgi:hypothetical protein